MFTSFRSRLIGILLVINLCVLVLGTVSYYFLGEVGGRLELFTQGMYHRMEIATRLREAADTRAIAVRNLALLTDSDQRTKALREFDRRQAETAAALAELRQAAANAGVPKEVSEKIEKIGDVEGRYSPVAQSIVDTLKSGNHDEAVRLIQTACNPTLEELSNALHDYMMLTEQRTRAFVAETANRTGWQRIALLVIALSALTLAATLGYLLLQNVRKTLGAEPEHLTGYLDKLAGGDLSMASGQGGAVPGSLHDAIDRMKGQMRAVVEQVRQASDSIATGASEIASGNADLSSRTELQASNLQQTASAMEQMNQSVQHSTQSAQAAAGLAGSVSAAAEGGSAVMEKVTETMGAISQSSAKIGDIIGVIDGIAFQTNILALNAAVEAARAGEQGRGFAVVASEVRTLAQRSAEAAREIKTLVLASVERVDAGNSLVSEAGHAVGNIVNEVQRVAVLIQEIGRSAQEQSGGIADVSSSVGSLDQSTQQNAALAEQSAAAAENLRRQSERLAEAVGYFQL